MKQFDDLIFIDQFYLHKSIWKNNYHWNNFNQKNSLFSVYYLCYEFYNLQLQFKTFNPIKAGVSESMYSLGGRPKPPPLKKGLRD